MLSLALVPALAVVPVQETPPVSLWDRLSLEAEGRIRGEATFDNVNTSTGEEIDDRYRGRLRLRLGAKYMLTEDLDVRARLSTASDAVRDADGDVIQSTDANNAYWDFGDGDGFSGAQVVLDQYYLDWRAAEELRVAVGKQPHAFSRPPIYGEFVWDGDVSPAGISAVYRPDTGDDLSFDVRGAGYVATEVAADEDPEMWGFQANFGLPLDELKLDGASALYDWGDNHDTAVFGNQGNSDVTDSFTIWDSFLAVKVPGGPLDEMTGFVEFIKNLDESDAGFVAGAQLGSSAWKRDGVNVFAVVYTLDGDSLFSPVAQDDTPVPGTGLNDGDGDGQDGILFGGTYFLRDDLAVKLWALTSDADGAEDEPIRVRIDFDFRVR